MLIDNYGKLKICVKKELGTNRSNSIGTTDLKQLS